MKHAYLWLLARWLYGIAFALMLAGQLAVWLARQMVRRV